MQYSVLLSGSSFEESSQAEQVSLGSSQVFGNSTWGKYFCDVKEHFASRKQSSLKKKNNQGSRKQRDGFQTVAHTI